MKWERSLEPKYEAPFAEFPTEKSLFLSHLKGTSSNEAEYSFNADIN